MERVWLPARQTGAGDAPEIALPFSIPIFPGTQQASHTRLPGSPEGWRFKGSG